jgi:alkanesulfonate monooxygenase SsuD/methylene tetrahydromethanopterin reductase-like flavin-dependent oxidoreductase (luciferase family)
MAVKWSRPRRTTLRVRTSRRHGIVNERGKYPSCATIRQNCGKATKYSVGLVWQGSFEDFARDRFIIGDKASVQEEIARYRELLGVDHFIMRCQWPGLPQEQVLSSIQRLGEVFRS